MFNNREIATAVWLTLFATWALTKPDVRASIARVFRSFLNWKILSCVTAMLLYSSATVAVFCAIGFWQLPMIKDTALWFCFTGFVMVMRFSTSRDDVNIVGNVFTDNLKLIMFIEFLIGTYVMPLAAELVFVPFVTLLVMLDAFAKLKKEHAVLAGTAKLTTPLLAIIGFAILGFAVWRAIGDFRSLGTMNTVRAIVFPPLMSIAFIPFIYVLVLIIAYESVFIRLAIGPDKTPGVVRYAKRRILFHCGLSLRRLREIASRPPFELMQIESDADVDRLVVGLHQIDRGPRSASTSSPSTRWPSVPTG